MPRQARDPFTDATLHFSTANVPCMRSQTSQQSIRSNTATGPSRPRQQRDLFAPALSRRPTNRSTPCIEDDVLADPDSEQEAAGIRAHRQIRSTRQGSPECKYGRTKPRPIEEVEFVNRQPNGNYLLAADEIDKALASQEVLPELQAEASIAESDATYATMARQFFVSGAASTERGGSKDKLDDFDEAAQAMIIRLREHAMHSINNDRWMYEPSDRFQPRA